MQLPHDWKAHKASGWWNLHHLEHVPCGWTTPFAYDIQAYGPFGESDARRVVYGHTCEDAD